MSALYHIPPNAIADTLSEGQIWMLQANLDECQKMAAQYRANALAEILAPMLGLKFSR